MLTAEPLLFRKEPLQTSQSFGVRTAKCLTTPAQEKKAQINVVARVAVASGPPVLRLPRRCSRQAHRATQGCSSRCCTAGRKMYTSVL